MSITRGLPKDCLLSVVRVTDNLMLSADPQRTRHHATEYMVENAAQFIARSSKVQETRGEYSTEFRLTVYVLSPEDLHRIIREEAYQMSSLIGRNQLKPGIES